MNKYSTFSQEDLLLLVILAIEESGEFASFETIVHDAFVLCPERFAFRKYPQWPDSLAIDRRLRDMRNPKGLIEGKAKLGFTLTPFGRAKADSVLRAVETGVRREGKDETRYGEPEYNVLNYTLNHPLFTAFATSPLSKAWTREDLYDFLKLPLEAPKRVAIEKLSRFSRAVEAFERKDVIEFMTKLKDAARRLR